MIKVMVFAKRRTGMTVEDFEAHWRSGHADLVRRQRSLARYVQNPTLRSAYQARGKSREPIYDGIAEAWFENLAILHDLSKTAEFEAVRADEAHFIDPATTFSLTVSEEIIVDGPIPEPSVKMFAFLNKRSDKSVEFFQNYWREKHGPIAALIPGNHRYVQCHVRPELYRSSRSPKYDGIPISWFENEDALRASGTSAEFEATRADECNFMAPGRLPFVIARGREIEL